jgi:hypothetical protein
MYRRIISLPWMLLGIASSSSLQHPFTVYFQLQYSPIQTDTYTALQRHLLTAFACIAAAQES